MGYAYSSKVSAPYVPSPPEVVKRMLEIAQLRPSDVVYDLGCGDGRILIAAVKDFGVNEAVGYEVRENLCKTTMSEIERQNLQDRVMLINGDMSDADLSRATVITLYLTSTANRLLKPKLEEAKPGTRVVSHDFSIEGWRAAKVESFLGHTIYLYITPEAFSPKR